ncbi:TonB-linked SusC/RagA family outer membrane protein [Dyadobacter jejuensis]|uniref:TonB-linked SusC/RagA family outer membrane protein n=1 Tax=Dyadobacter jejuensis TaxID=1082580 RepID=A0A316AL69_9BACT|nr:TonB-dependent receptor [Dyadobacter jejuensis]PWJ57999.1 TonB-linked SusC/RagA family outer membrane protein [Dyadobacter jejuensis]
MLEMSIKLGKYLGVLFLLLCFGTAFGQAQVTGKVYDASDDTGIPGANVLVKGTTTGTSTDVDGNFTLNLTQNDAILVISFTGYTTQEIPVKKGSKVEVRLEASSKLLSEIVVVGYGTRKKSDVTGSVAQVGTKDFKDQPVTRVEEALQGRASGVMVSRSSGNPGGAIKVRVRGVNSITGNNDPLVVVDGVIGLALNSINPNDIESMEVLKDASATAIYGSRGSNGVILVSTKKGSSKPRLDVDVFTGFSYVPKFIDVLGAYDFARIENSRRINNGGNAVFTDQELAGFQANGGVDYQRELFQTGRTNNVQLSTSGRSGKINYFVSGNYMKQDGIVMTTRYSRLSGRVNVSSDITDKLRVGVNLFATRENNHNNLDDQREYQGSMILRALTWDPTTPIRNDQGVFNNYSLRSLAHLGYNPIADMSTRDLNLITDRFNANINVNYRFNDHFSYTAVGGLGSSNSTNSKYLTTPPFPAAFFNNGQTSLLQMSNIMAYEQVFGKHNLKVTGVYEFQQNTYSGNGYSATNYLVPSGFYLAELAAGKNLSNDYNKNGIESLMGRAEYIFNDRLFLTGTVRRDKSSRFRKDKNVGIFPSVALAYNLSSLPMLAAVESITNLKLRAGWGQVGNQNIAPYSTYPSVNINGGYPFDGKSLTPGSRPDGYGNADLTWETTTQYNLGVDLGLFQNRINVSVDAYQKKTTDLLLNVPVPAFAGGGAVLRNVGEVENKGIDLSLSGAVINKQNFRWDATMTMSKIANKVVKLDGRSEIQGSFLNIDGSGRALNVIQVGQPLGQFYGETFLGTWKTAEADEALKVGAKPGDSKYLTDENGVTVLQAIGNGMPKFSWGFNNTIAYKNWDLNMFINGMSNFQILNVTQGLVVGATGNQRGFLSPTQLNQWTPTNETDIPVGGQNRTASSRYVENGAFARLNNVSLSYTFKKIKGIESLKVYASGQNLVLITGFSGYDPEGSDRNYDGGNDDTAAGVNVGAYPNPRTVTFGIKIGL